MVKERKTLIDSHAPAYVSGVIIGLLLASVGFLYLQEKLFPSEPVQIKTVVVTKVVTRTHVVEKAVDHTTVVKETRLYKATLLDANGNVVGEWVVTKCKFRVIGATLTDQSGKTFEVRGNIKVQAIE